MIKTLATALALVVATGACAPFSGNETAASVVSLEERTSKLQITTTSTPDPWMVERNASEIWGGQFFAARNLVNAKAELYGWDKVETLEIMTEWSSDLVRKRWVDGWTFELALVMLPEVMSRLKYLQLHTSGSLSEVMRRFEVIWDEIMYCFKETDDTLTAGAACTTSIWETESSLRVSQFNSLSEVIMDYSQRYGWSEVETREIGVAKIVKAEEFGWTERESIGSTAEGLGVLVFIDSLAFGGILEALKIFEEFEDPIKYCVVLSDTPTTSFWDEFFECLAYIVRNINNQGGQL